MNRWILALAVLSLVAVENALGQVQYALTDLGTLDGIKSTASGVYNNGQVVGSAFVSSHVEHAFLYSGGTMQDLGTISGANSEGYGINNSGQVVGQADISGGTYDAFLNGGGTMHDLGTLGGYLAYATAINDGGQVVGCSVTSVSNGVHAFLYSGGTMHDLGTFGGAESWAFGINNSAQVVGSVENSGYASAYAFLYSGGTIQNLGTFGGQYSQADGINNAGQLVGGAYTSSGAEHAFLHTGSGSLNSVTDDLGTLSAPYNYRSEALGINNSGQVVGWSSSGANTGEQAFLYSGGTMNNLNNFIPSASGWTLEQATGINDNGQICGYGINPSGQTDSFLLTPTAPTPEPSTVALLGVGAVALIGYRWRRHVLSRKT